MTAAATDFTSNVRAQADFRLKFGVPVALAIVGILYFISPDLTLHYVVGAALVLYTAYTVAVRYLALRVSERVAKRVVVATAICDPIFLSVWLYAVGDPSILFVGLYTFTVLGFGFRIGNWAMFLCQSVSVAGFLVVMLASPRWSAVGVSELSHLVMMLMVPLYAAALIRRLHTAKALAEHESKAKSMLLAKVSHELRTPLTGIVSAAQLIEMETKDAAIAGRAQAIHDMAIGLDGEIGQMLDLARMDAGVKRLESIPLEAADVAAHVLRTLLPVASSKGIDLQCVVDPRISKKIVGPAGELGGVLVNLAGNAIKFTPKGTVTVEIHLLEDKGKAYRLRFSVSDTGIGIAKEHLSRIFEPFYQVETGPNRKFGGTGLGTTVAMERVKQLGGLLQVESTVGEGTRFWFDIVVPTAGSSPLKATLKAPVRLVTGKRVLIADDNRVNLELLRQMLVKDEHVVTTATSGSQAAQLLAREDFDLVLLDYNLGDIDGAAVFQAYAFGRIHTAPTYFITADTTAETGLRLAEVGVKGVIYKPISIVKLRDAIANTFADEVVVVREAPASQEPGAPGSAERGQAGTGSGRGKPALKAVPVEVLDPEAFEQLREIRDSPEFLASMLTEGLEDIANTHGRLAASLKRGHLPEIHHDAHTLRGLSLSFGAVRLAAAADRLMSISQADLDAAGGELTLDLGEKYAQSVSALQQLRDQQVAAMAGGEGT